MKTAKGKPLTPAQTAMLERLKDFFEETPFIPSGLGQDQTILALRRRGILGPRFIAEDSQGTFCMDCGAKIGN